MTGRRTLRATAGTRFAAYLLSGCATTLIAIAAGEHAMAQGTPALDPAVPVCGIDEHVSGAGVTIRGVVAGGAGLSGRYRLQIKKTGPSGTSDISQGGEFTLEAGIRLGVGQVGLSLETGGRYDAVLTLVVSGGGTLECRASGPRSSPL